MVPGGKEFNQLQALSLSEKGKSLSLIAFLLALLCLKVSHSSRNWTRWLLEFLYGKLENCKKFCIIWMKTGLILKLFTYIGTIRILDWALLSRGLMYSFNGLSPSMLTS